MVEAISAKLIDCLGRRAMFSPTPSTSDLGESADKRKGPKPNIDNALAGVSVAAENEEISRMSAGIVYILTNAAMPGYVKIGLTRQNDVSERVRQLDNTSIPVPFECYHAARVPDCAKLERTLHFVFGENRARRSREFFTIDPDLAKAIIDLVAESPIEVSDAQQAIDPGERREIETIRKKREARTFTSMNVPMGATLTFVKDPNVTCTVVKARKVLFQGQEMSPSAAALRAVHDMGYEWVAVSGMEYWQYDGVKLGNLGEREVEADSDNLDELIG